MIIPKQAVPSTSIELCLPLIPHFLELMEWKRSQIPFLLALLLIQTDMFELEHHGKFTAVRIAVKFGDLRSSTPGFTYRNQIISHKCMCRHFFYVFMKLRTIGCDLLIRHFSHQINNIQAESTNSLIDPEIDNIPQLLSQLRILPVQIRLFHRKLMEIILFYFRYPLPCRTAESSFHIIGKYSLFSITPYIVIMIRIFPALFRFYKPFMFIGRMIQY